MFALLVNLRQLRITIAMLNRQIYGVGSFPQNLPMPGIEVAIDEHQVCEPTSCVKRDRCD